jgi:hypothetical protein
LRHDWQRGDPGTFLLYGRVFASFEQAAMVGNDD